ncbi:MAG: mechanosensitive ion channel [Candidatus Brocadiaceae bacterium]|nr:mechanosensitive ion channel [Candidatus Brocadiaceae bacterium]
MPSDGARMVGPYRIVERIGEGSTGEVFRAVQPPRDRVVAVKVFAERFAGGPEAFARFEREVGVAARLKHPGIVPVIDCGRDGDAFYAVMEHVDGQSLATAMGAGPMPPADVMDCALQVCDALACAHAEGVVHGNLKPSNILLDAATGRARISDFAIAAFRTEGVGAGTMMWDMRSAEAFHYMAPELQLDAHRASAQSEVYSLGVILYEMLTATAPVGHFKPPSMVRDDVPIAMDAVISRCLAESAGDRYRSVDELKRALLRLRRPQRRRRRSEPVVRRLDPPAAAVLIVLLSVVPALLLRLVGRGRLSSAAVSHDGLMAALTFVLVALGAVLVTRLMLRARMVRGYIWLLPVLTVLSVGAWVAVHSTPLRGGGLLLGLTQFMASFSAFVSVLVAVARAALPDGAQRTRGGVPPLIRKLAVLVCAFLGFFLLIKWAFPGLDLTPVFVTSGALSIVVGLAVQDSLHNVLAGVVLSTERPFQVGDWIRIQDVEGAVTEVSWRVTKILTRQNDHVEVPNSVIIRERVLNHTRPTSLHLRKVRVGVAYEVPPGLAVGALTEAAARVGSVLKSPAPGVHFVDYADSALIYELRAYIDDYAAAEATDSELRKEIWYAFRRHAITIPFPQRDVNLRQIAEAPRRRRGRFVAAVGLPRGFVFELLDGRTTIGRSPENVLCITNQHVSSSHAVVEQTEDGFVIHDLNSRWGTKVNGEPVQSAPLSPGDVVEVGPIGLVFETDEAPAAGGPHRWLHGPVLSSAAVEEPGAASMDRTPEPPG